MTRDKGVLATPWHTGTQPFPGTGDKKGGDDRPQKQSDRGQGHPRQGTLRKGGDKVGGGGGSQLPLDRGDKGQGSMGYRVTRETWSSVGTGGQG